MDRWDSFLGGELTARAGRKGKAVGLLKIQVSGLRFCSLFSCMQKNSLHYHRRLRADGLWISMSKATSISHVWLTNLNAFPILTRQNGLVSYVYPHPSCGTSGGAVHMSVSNMWIPERLYYMIVIIKASSLRLPGFETQLHHFIVMWPWAIVLTSLCTSYLLYIMRIIISTSC